MDSSLDLASSSHASIDVRGSKTGRAELKVAYADLKTSVEIDVTETLRLCPSFVSVETLFVANTQLQLSYSRPFQMPQDSSKYKWDMDGEGFQVDASSGMLKSTSGEGG